MELIFAILNSVLYHSLKQWSARGRFQNKFGENISCQFIDLRDQFQGVGNPEGLFVKKEVDDCKTFDFEMTHRTIHHQELLLDEVINQLNL